MRYTIHAAGALIYDSMSPDAALQLVNPTCKRERGKAGTLSFGVLYNHDFYDSFNRLTTEVTCEEDGVEIFRGRVYEIETDIWKQRSITCEGDLAYLVDSLQPPDRIKKTVTEDVTSTATDPWGTGTKTSTRQVSTETEEPLKEKVYDHFKRQIQNHWDQVDAWKRFTVGNVTIDERDTEAEFDASNYRETMNAIESDLLNYYGGYLQTRRVGGTTYIDYIKEATAVATQTINFGQNMIDMTETLPSDEIFSVLIPTGDDELTISGVNGGKNTIENATAISKYGRIYKTESFSGITDANRLKTLGQTFMNRNCKTDPIKFSITALDLKNLGMANASFKIGEKIRVISAPHGIDRTLECLSIEIKMDEPDQTKFEIGDPDDTFSQKYKKDTDKNSNAAADANSSASTGKGAGGQHFKLLKEVDKELQFYGDQITFTQEKVTINAQEIYINAQKILTNAKKIEACEAVVQVFTVTANTVSVGRNLFAPRVTCTELVMNSSRIHMSHRELAVRGYIGISVPYRTTTVSGKSVVSEIGECSASHNLHTEEIYYLSHGTSAD